MPVHVCIVVACIVVQGNRDQDSIFRELFYSREYNRINLPVMDLSETTHVEFGLVLVKIVEVVCISLLYNYVTTLAVL